MEQIETMYEQAPLPSIAKAQPETALDKLDETAERLETALGKMQRARSILREKPELREVLDAVLLAERIHFPY